MQRNRVTKSYKTHPLLLVVPYRPIKLREQTLRTAKVAEITKETAFVKNEAKVSC